MGAYEPDPVYYVEARHLTQWPVEGKTMQSVQDALTKLGVHHGVHPEKGHIVVMSRLGGSPYNISTRHNFIEQAIWDYRQRIHATRSGLALEYFQTLMDADFPGAKVGGGVVSGKHRIVSYTITFPDVFKLPTEPPLPQVQPQLEDGTPIIEPIHDIDGCHEVQCWDHDDDKPGAYGEMYAMQRFPLNDEAQARIAFVKATQDPKWRHVLLMQYDGVDGDVVEEWYPDERKDIEEKENGEDLPDDNPPQL